MENISEVTYIITHNSVIIRAHFRIISPGPLVQGFPPVTGCFAVQKPVNQSCFGFFLVNQGPWLLSKFPLKIHLRQEVFPNMVSDWQLVVVLPANQMPVLNVIMPSSEQIHVANCSSREVEFPVISLVNTDSLRIAQKRGGPVDYGPRQRCKHCQQSRQPE